MRRWVRTVLAFAIALAAWVVAMPARAATPSDADAASVAPAIPPIAGGRAPLCDDRAATMFAPAPQLQAPETSIDTASSADDCIANFLEDGVAHQDNDAPRGAPSAPDAGMTLAIPAVPPSPHAAAEVPGAAFFAVPRGIHMRLDRPPRLV